MDQEWRSRRSPVLTRNGAVASSQPLATAAGIRVLQAGGNAADAAVAAAAMLGVTEPCSTGLGGDAFMLFWDAKSKTVRGLNGSGRSAASLTRDALFAAHAGVPPAKHHADTVTVPGAAAAWVDTVAQCGSGRVTMQQVLQPAIDAAETGFPVHPVAAHFWHDGADLLRAASGNAAELLMPDRSAPAVGQVMRNPTLAETMRVLARDGKPGFYTGRIAQAIVDVVREQGGSFLQPDDLADHTSEWVDPCHVQFAGVDVYEIPPNGQGITALIALNILAGLLPGLGDMQHNSAEYLHALIEALRIAFADARHWVADMSRQPDGTALPLAGLLSRSYADKRRAALFRPDCAATNLEHGYPESGSDTVYLSVVDGEGNACSFINSNYMGFGTGIVPKGCGFSLQNRGANFASQADHPNAWAGGKRPYHTIIPALAVRDGELYACFGVMGGFMQPQGHVQVLLNMLLFGMDPQAALDAPRFCIGPGHGSAVGGIAFEQGIAPSVLQQLREKYHHVVEPVHPLTGWQRSRFGRGQIITRDPCTGLVSAGSDPRADGCAAGW